VEKNSTTAVPVIYLQRGIIFIYLIMSLALAKRCDRQRTARIRVLFSTRGIALVLGGTAYARECIGACWINKCILSLSLSLSLSRSYDSVLTAHRSRLHRRAIRQRQKGIFIIHPGAVFLLNALANTYEYLLGKTWVYINSDIKDLDLWRNKANMSLTNSIASLIKP